MSTLRATNIKNPDSGSNNIVLSEGGGVVISGVTTVSNANITGGSITGISTVGVTTVTTTNLTVNGNAYPTAGPLSNRNLIINGDMRIDQRNAGVSINPTNGQYSVDRFKALTFPTGKFTLQKNAGSVTPPVGFLSYLGATSSSAYTVSSTDYFGIIQSVEGYNIANLAWGTSNAKSTTLSFWVRSSLTGTFGVAFGNENNDRGYAATYTISSANTWEYKTITIAGPTTGTWNTTNGTGIQIVFGLGIGSNTSTTPGSWVNSFVLGATGATSVVGTNGATFYLTGVQLEVGEVATPFEHRSYGDELARCQRYCERIDCVAQYMITTNVAGTSIRSQSIPFTITKRATPTLTFTNSNSEYIVPNGGGVAYSNYNFVTFNDKHWRVDDSTSRTTGTIISLTGTLIASAEL